MRTEHLYRWRIQWGGGWVTTRHRWTEGHIRREHPEAQRVDGSLELREVPESPAEREAHTFRGFAHLNTGGPHHVHGWTEPPAQRFPRHACMLCRGEGWVCEEHNDVPWLECYCDAKRMQCLCNPWCLVTWSAGRRAVSSSSRGRAA
ncbi:MAG: hypothetical protein HS128_02985 [Ideonella sp.]|nr:hypothetical protein [Ideonella sp.]